jgi:hypothetical protein
MSEHNYELTLGSGNVAKIMLSLLEGEAWTMVVYTHPPTPADREQITEKLRANMATIGFEIAEVMDYRRTQAPAKPLQLSARRMCLRRDARRRD